MSEEIDKLYSLSTNLMDRVEDLRLSFADESTIDLIERAANLGNIATLYYEELSKEELDRVSSVLALSYNMIKDEDILKEKASLENVIIALETLFREKKLLLGETSKKQAA